MPTRHTGTLTALLLTAALFLALPGLWRTVSGGDSNRMAESLRPARMRTITVWLLPDGPDDAAFLRQCCAGFEKQQPGARIFLRRVTADELYAENAVLPDVVLFGTGEIIRPEDALVPLALEQPHASARYAGALYAAALWYEPLMLCYPESWGENPWPMLTQRDALELPEGAALQQLLLTCPEGLRPSLVDAVLGRIQPTPAPVEKQDSVPRSRGMTPTPAPPVTSRAQAAAKPREGQRAIPLQPDTSDRVRYAALCRDSEDARAFLAHLCAQCPEGFSRAQETTVLPNAFAHTRAELDSLCRDGFERLRDPALTLLTLR